MAESFDMVSDHLLNATYDKETEVLDITFTDLSSYSYDNVPEDVAMGLKRSVSASHYFRNYIKGRYRFFRA